MRSDLKALAPPLAEAPESIEAISVRNLGKCLRRSQGDQAQTLQERIARAFQPRRPAAEKFWALRDVNFTVAQGTTLGIIGRNGAGKSTLMRLLGGVGRPNTGTARVRGRLGALLELGAGFHPDLTGRENTYINGTISGLTRREIAQRFDSITAFAELEDFIDAPLRTYSSGMQMRLAFAIAAHTDPSVLLIDEVLAVGDAAFQEKCLLWIERFKQSGRTIVLVSHDAELVRDFCDQVLWLEKGEIVAYGPADEVVRQYMDATLHHKSHSLSAEEVGEPGQGIEQTGTGEIRITGVRVVDALRETVSEIRSGDALSIEISWHAMEPIGTPLFSAAITRPDGFVCYATSTEGGGLDLPLAQGDGVIYLHLERLDLVGGRYLVDTAVYSVGGETIYHDVRSISTFAVRSTERSGNGVLHTPHRWTAVTK